jgi:hypothetical protein
MKLMYKVMSRTMGSVKRMRIGRLTFRTMSSLKSTSISSCLACMPQFFVRRRSSDALLMSMTGGYVSSMNSRSRANEAKPMKLLMYSVQRQPR